MTEKPRPYQAAAPLLLALSLLALTALTLALPTAPAPLPADAPAEQFSARRAFEHIEVIGQEPHPIGSAAIDRVRSYLLAELTDLGLEPQVQETLSVRAERSRAAIVRNVVARLEGSAAEDHAILLIGHYDSVPPSFGANDDGAAVATLLETARALLASPPLRNDVIFLFTDGEEVGLLGATAFEEQHAWADDVALALNFEARGSTGVVYTFETGPQNGQAVAEFARAVPYPVASSLMGTVYANLPNDTDFTVFRRAGLPGFNFGYIGGAHVYHTALDTPASLDLRSLQHHGSYALGLTRHFGGLQLPVPQRPNAVYFDVLGHFLVHYPGGWAIPLALLALGAYLGAAVLGLRRGRATPAGIGLGFLALLGSVVAGALAVWLTWWLVSRLHPHYRYGLLSDLYNARWYGWAFATLAVAAGALLYTLLRKRMRTADLALGALLAWLILTLATSFTLPGLSYLFLWPLLFGLAGLLLTFARPVDERPLLQAALLALTAAPAFVLLVPIIGGLFVALSIDMALVPAILIGLTLGLLIPHLALLARPAAWALPALAGLVALTCLAGGSMSAGFDARHPYPNSVWYGLDASEDRAYWIGMEDPDAWTGQFLDGTSGEVNEVFPQAVGLFPKTSALLVSIPAPQIELLEDTLGADPRTGAPARTLRLRLLSPRGAESVRLYVTSQADDAEPLGIWLAGQPLESTRRVEFWAPPPEGFELTLQVPAGSGPVELVVTDRTPGLPDIPGFTPNPRPAEMMPAADSADETVVSQHYTFP